VKVLVVDDDEAGRYLLESILSASGYEVASAIDGIDALDKASRAVPDLVITDVLMPRMDGYKLCVRLKNDPGLRGVPILVYTSSFGDPADKRFALSLGVNAFMLKPQDPDALLAEVERLLASGVPGAAGPAADEPGMLLEYGERISQKLYQKLLEIEQKNADLNQAMARLNAEVDAKTRLISQLSRAIAKEQEAQEALLVSQERYAAAVRGAMDGIWDWDIAADTLFASPRFRDLLRVPDNEALETVDQWLDRVSPEDRERLRFEIDLHVRGLTPHFESEYRVPDASGGFRWMLSRGQAVRREDQTPYRMAGSLTDITDRKHAEEQLLRNALYDGLTGLPNRTLFMDRMSFLETRRARHGEYQYAVLFIDLDRFKNVNESLGHAAGDAMLVEAARRLVACLRTGDTAARFSGDEFVVLLDDVKEPQEADRLAAVIQSSLAVPFAVDGHEVYSSASIGIAMTSDLVKDPEELLRDAETAMYRAKEAGRARSEVFDAVMHARAVTALQTEGELRRAIERGELEPFYQPVVCLESGAVVSCEALVRWNHPERGLLGPYEFVSVAEESGLIVPMGLVVMRAACERNLGWQKAGHAPIKVSVNISARQFAEPDLLESIQAVLAETGMAPEHLLLELTESVVMADPARAEKTLDALHELGVSLAVDDFGTGYSSLSYLKRFPFHMLKIDRSFVMDIPRDADDMTIVEAVVGLAHSLKLQVTAEGVETPEQLDFLRGLGCDNMQGFLVSRPVPAAEFEDLLRRGRLLPS
jgi:diguanylate cyclase (GGDEF)-like protein/PAS domain S-box-containing protein